MSAPDRFLATGREAANSNSNVQAQKINRPAQEPSMMPITLPPLKLAANAPVDRFRPRLPAIEPPMASSAQDRPYAPESASQRLAYPFPSPSAFPPQISPAPPSMAARPANLASPTEPRSIQAQGTQRRSNPSFQLAQGTRTDGLAALVPRRPESTRRVELRIRQQPRAARACGFGERDRRVIDPPPLLEVVDLDPASDSSNNTTSPHMMSVLNATLWDEHGTTDVTFAQPQNRRTGGRLMGTLVASCINATDEHGRWGYFFAFPDLSCRAYGRYRLRFSLVQILPATNGVGSVAPILTHAMTDVFTVYSASEFPGMRPSSALTIALREQGINIPIKKGKRSGLPAPGDESDAGSEQEGPPSSRRPKPDET